MGHICPVYYCTYDTLVSKVSSAVYSVVFYFPFGILLSNSQTSVTKMMVIYKEVTQCVKVLVVIIE